MELGDSLVHEPAAPTVEVDAGPLVLAPVDAHAEAQHEASAREQLERRGLLGHRGGAPQGELKDAGAEGGPAGRRGGHGQRGAGFPHRVRPEQVVHGPQRVGPVDLGPPAELGHLGGGSGRTGGTTAFSHSSPCVVGGRSSPSMDPVRLFLPGSHRQRTAERTRRLLRRTRGERAPSGRSITDSVQRAAQMALPSSSVRSIDHTCTVRPTRTGVAVAVRCPWERDRT